MSPVSAKISKPSRVSMTKEMLIEHYRRIKVDGANPSPSTIATKVFKSSDCPKIAWGIMWQEQLKVMMLLIRVGSSVVSLTGMLKATTKRKLGRKERSQKWLRSLVQIQPCPFDGMPLWFTSL